MTALQAKAALLLFDSRQFDSFDIAHLLGVNEADVVRIVGAARALMRDDPATRRRVPA